MFVQTTRWYKGKTENQKELGKKQNRSANQDTHYSLIQSETHTHKPHKHTYTTTQNRQEFWKRIKEVSLKSWSH